MFDNIRTNISVCMATYNGAKYLKEQIDSILVQLVEGDELIIVDDCSSDETIKIIGSYDTSNIKLYVNDLNLGHCKSFERAISLSKNEYIFLADQDDIWPLGRVNMMLEAMQKSGCKVINGVAADFVGDSLDINKLYFHKEYPVYGYFMELFKSLVGFHISPRMGCAMVFHSSLKKLLLPFPTPVTQHDIYIANVANLLNTYYFFPKIILYHRIHANNVSTKKNRPLDLILKERLLRLVTVFLLLFRILLQNKTSFKRVIKE